MKYRFLPFLLALSLTPRPGAAAGISAGPASGGSTAAAPLSAPSGPLELLKPESDGVYHDAKGAAHPWSVGQSHVLQWDGTPYLPAGALVQPLSWGVGADGTSWDRDRAALDMLAKHGVRDVLLSAGDRGLTRVPPADVQRVLDYLDAHGFSYGLRIADSPDTPLVGYVVKPAVYRNPSPPSAGPARFRHIPGLAEAFYLLVSPRDSEIDERGAARIVGGDTAEVTLQNAGTDDVLLLFPQRLYPAGTPEGHLPDLWEGYDEYRDRVLGFFGHVTLGPGFRFFLDPLTDHLGLNGEVGDVVPTSDGCRLDFQAWLARRYNHNVDDLNRGWGIRDHDLPDFATAARCLPLWSGTKGVPAVYDPEKKAAYAVLNNPLGGHTWEDFRRFRLDSVRGYMNSMADVLKKSVADVPVVYAWGGRSALFTNEETRGGYDGLAMPADGSSAYAFAQSEETPKTSWLLCADTLPAASAIPAWDGLKDSGARGFFAPVALGEEAARLGQYAATLSFQGQDLTQTPRVLAYPAGVANVGVGLRRLTDGVWWLPSYRAGDLFQPGDAFTLGPLLRGYKLNDPDGRLPRFVVWAPHGGVTETRFPFPKNSPAVITDAAGLPLKVDKKKDSWTVPVGPDPIVISRVSRVPLPADAADAADKEATRLAALAKEQGLNVELDNERLFQVRNTIPTSDKDADLRYDAFARIIGDLSRELQPYLWLEGESAASYTFDSLVSDSEASGGSYLALDTDRPPPGATGDTDGGYRADYKFTVSTTAAYTLWLGGSAVSASSPFTYTLDDGAANPVQDVETEGGNYAGRFVWSRIGAATLARGPHRLTLTVTGPRASDGRYALSVDVLCLSRVPFHPDGTQMPAIDFLPPPVEKDKKGRPIQKKGNDDADAPG